MNNPVKHHYVPQCYQRRFSTDKKTVKYFDKDTQKLLSKAIENFCQIEYLYFLEQNDNHYFLETKFFSQGIEDKLGRLLNDFDKIGKTDNILMFNKDKKKSVTKQIVLQYMRTPKYRNIKYHNESQAYLYQIGILLDKLGIDTEEFGFYSDKREYHKRRLCDVFEVDEIVDGLINAHWELWYTDNSEFYTSDNPVVIMERQDMPVTYCDAIKYFDDIYFPLNPNLLLHIVATQPISNKQIAIKAINKGKVNDTNKIIKNKASHYIIYKNIYITNMDKLKMRSLDVIGSNIQKIAQLFPNCVTERLGKDGKPELAIDFDKLRQELACEVVEGAEERYQFTWPDKRAAIRLANAPTNKTLRPCREESVDFDNTQNLYIEGDNLEVLKLLRENYLGKVKMIYIDPPYNTGNDFVYYDEFDVNKNIEEERNGFWDEDGNQALSNFERNTAANGRFHTDWLNMIYPRLKVAKDLLADDGVIFISIDDYEVENLRKTCDEIYGSSNFIAQVVWERSYAPINMVKHFSKSHDYILCYAKYIDSAICNGLPRPDSTNAKYSNPDNDPRGLWRTDNLSVGPVVESKVYEIVTPSGRICLPPKGRCWLYTKERFEEMVADNRIWFGENGDNVPAPKRFLSEVKQGLTPMTIWKYTDVGHTQDSMRELRELFDGEKVFDYSKPVKLMKQVIQLYTSNNSEDIILDFFSGSATTAHAVMKLNAEDGGNRKFIMVQLPEKTDEKSEAYKAGYKNICEIGKERIRRAGRKIKEELGIKLDVGFRVLKLDSSNMEDVYYTPQDFSIGSLFTENVKADRTNEDLLFQVMLDLGIELSAKIESKQIAGKNVHFVDDNYLVACFDRDLNESTITEIAKLQPIYFVMRDASAANDNVIDNFEQIFRHYSPDTVCRII